MADLVRYFLKYILTGGSASLVDVCFFAAFQAVGLGITPAATLSFGIGTVVNYVLTSLYAFRMRPTPSGYLRFLSAALLGACVNVGTTIYAGQLLGISPILAKTMGIAIAFLLNFTLAVTVVYRRPPTEKQGPGDGKRSP